MKSSHAMLRPSIEIITAVDLTLGSWTDLSRPTISRSMSSLPGRGGVGAAEPTTMRGGSSPMPQLASGLSRIPNATVSAGPSLIGRRIHGTPASSRVVVDPPSPFWAFIVVFSCATEVGKARHWSMAEEESIGVTQNLTDRPLKQNSCCINSFNVKQVQTRYQCLS